MSGMKHILQAVTLFATLSLTSCEHKELCYDYSHSARLQVVFDWSNAPGAAPEAMRLYLFPTDGGKSQMYEFTDCRGGYISVPAGNYSALCVNSDTESILYRNMEAFDRFEVYTPEDVLIVRPLPIPRAKGTSEEQIVKCPDHLYRAHLDKVIVEGTSASQTVILFPEESVCHYRVEVRNVSNLKDNPVDGIFGTLSGMSGSLLAGRNEHTGTPVTVPFEVASDGVSTLTADFLTFGQMDSGRVPHKLVIYVTMPDGSRNYYTYDVGRQVDEAPDSRNVHIVVDGLRLPEHIGHGSGFHPDVDEWQNVDVDVPM